MRQLDHQPRLLQQRLRHAGMLVQHARRLRPERILSLPWREPEPPWGQPRYARYELVHDV